MSAKHYFAADLHLGHEGVAKHRGFSSVEEHDKLIIDNWNSVVRKNDTVIVAGDLFMNKKCIPMLQELVGNIRVVGGNHDTRDFTRLYLGHVKDYVGAYDYKGFIVTHIPVHPMCLDRYKGNIHGHLHEKLVKRSSGMVLGDTVKDHRYFNVSLEQIDYKPIAFTALVERFEERIHG